MVSAPWKTKLTQLASAIVSLVFRSCMDEWILFHFVSLISLFKNKKPRRLFAQDCCLLSSLRGFEFLF